jgi:hypothetical protein
MLIAFGAGQYIYIATVELFRDSPYKSHHNEDAKTSNIKDNNSKLAESSEPSELNHENPSYNEADASTVSDKEENKDTYQALGLLSFIVGAVAVGLVLLDHSHCETSHSNNDSHGH